ncbi:MAG: hypothetical protein ACOYLI_10270 [Synechococcus lacustris]
MSTICRLELVCTFSRYLAAFAFICFAPLGRAEELQQVTGPDQGQRQMSDLVVPNDTFKFVVAPLQSSNRFEYNHYLPLVLSPNSQLFIDNTVYAKQRPIETSDTDGSYIQTIGESVRLGYRQLLKGADSFWGINAGYDNALQAGFYYQQLGVGLELTSPNFQLVSTFAAPIGNRSYANPGEAVLSPFNIQVALPTGLPNLVLLPRFYYVYDRLGESSPGGQVQLNYGINPQLTLEFAVSYDYISGSGGALELKWRPNVPVAPVKGSLINPAILGSYAGPVGNTGTRIIRLTGSDPAFGE